MDFRVCRAIPPANPCHFEIGSEAFPTLKLALDYALNARRTALQRGDKIRDEYFIKRSDASIAMDSEAIKAAYVKQSKGLRYCPE